MGIVGGWQILGWHPLKTNMTGWKIPIFSRKHIFKCWFSIALLGFGGVSLGRTYLRKQLDISRCLLLKSLLLCSLYIYVFFFVKESKQPTTNQIAGGSRLWYNCGQTMAQRCPRHLWLLWNGSGRIGRIDGRGVGGRGEIWQRCVFVPPYFSDVYKGIRFWFTSII